MKPGIATVFRIARREIEAEQRAALNRGEGGTGMIEDIRSQDRMFDQLQEKVLDILTRE